MKKSMQNPKILKRMLKTMPEVDQAVLVGERAELLLEGMRESMRESFRQGVDAATYEGRLYALPWGFELADIAMPVTIWQGALDTNVPLSNGHVFAHTIPQATSHFLPDQGHLSLLINHGAAILTNLVVPIS